MSTRLRTLAAVLVLTSGVVTVSRSSEAAGDPQVLQIRSSVVTSDGETRSITNHIRTDLRWQAEHGRVRPEWLLVWAGDAEPGNPTGTAQHAHGQTQAADTPPDPDFLAVIDATRGSPQYGKVVNTVTIDGVFGNEPHHMQYSWHKGDKVYAGGLLSDTTYVFDVGKLPQVALSGVTLPADTPCGSAPDAYWTLKDGTAYGSYMGGPDVSGPCQYTNGEVREGNGAAGSPGEVVHLGPAGRVLGDAPASVPTPEYPDRCLNVPALPNPSCANPHGLQAREDLNRLVAADFAEVRDLVYGPKDYRVGRPTVRIFDITQRDHPRLLSVSRLPDGPRPDADPIAEESSAVMEVTVTNQRHHRGAFAGTMSGGAIYYTPDITAPDPQWREVFDDTTAFKSLFADKTPAAGSDGGAWLQTSADDHYLFHTVLQGGPSSPSSAGMVYVLDIRKLLAAGTGTTCSIDTLPEVGGGGAEPDCPRLADALPIVDDTSGGPHWGTLDNFAPGFGGSYHEAARADRLVVSNYFVAAAHFDGDHRVCMVDVGPDGRLSYDQAFRDEVTGQECVNFNRPDWPHGETGWARPHGVLFAVADRDVR
jgi:hypothetical protein